MDKFEEIFGTTIFVWLRVHVLWALMINDDDFAVHPGES